MVDPGRIPERAPPGGRSVLSAGERSQHVFRRVPVHRQGIGTGQQHILANGIAVVVALVGDPDGVHHVQVRSTDEGDLSAKKAIGAIDAARIAEKEIVHRVITAVPPDDIGASDKTDQVLPGDGRAGHNMPLEHRQIDKGQTVGLIGTAIPHSIAHAYIGPVSGLKFRIRELVRSCPRRIL